MLSYVFSLSLALFLSRPDTLLPNSKALCMTFYPTGTIQACMGQNTGHVVWFCIGPNLDVIWVSFGFQSNNKETKKC